jgi:hypothetical protein
MSLLADLEEFVSDHRPHGPLTADATEPAWNGYLSPWPVQGGCLSGRSRLRMLATCSPKTAPPEMRVGSAQRSH